MEGDFLYKADEQQFSKRLLLPAPKRNLILILGILSIPCCCCLNGIIGIIFAIIAIVLAEKSKKCVLENTDVYNQETLIKVKTGKTCAIIGLICSAIMLIAALIAIIIARKNGFGGLTSFEGIWNQTGY